MTESMQAVPEMLPTETNPKVPWTFLDSWIGFVLFFILFLALGLINNYFTQNWMMAVWLLVYQPLQFIPVFIIMKIRKATWADLGFRKGQPNVLALGCGFIVLSFIVTFINNIIMMLFKFQIQAERFTALANDLHNPAVLLITGAVIAPLFEETIFRGFLFPGLRQKMGWQKAALLSSAIFAACHLQLAAFIPTFTLGLVFCYLYQRSSSIWPGIILHTLVNSFSLCVLVTLMQNVGPITFWIRFLWI
ncbi:MAG: type II CAAX endopeptidase family protein [Anaerolineales bacterium]